MFEIDEGIGRPQALLKLFAGDDFAGAFEEDEQNLEGLRAELKPNASPVKLPGSRSKVKSVELKRWHRGPNFRKIGGQGTTVTSV